MGSLAEKLKMPNFSPSDYWKTLKSFIKPANKTKIPPINNDDVFIADSKQKANLLNDLFVRQSELNDSEAVLPAITIPQGQTLTNTIIPEEEVKSTLLTLKSRKSSGPDNINNRILKELAIPLSKPLCSLFNISLAKGIFPVVWKHANVTPLYKKGRSLPSL